MAERNSPPNERLPIKLVLPKQGRERPVTGRRSSPIPFRAVTPAFRNSLKRQVEAIRDTTWQQMKEVKAAPVRVKVLTKAAAKSHRPEELFSEKTCPIVGAGRLGELFVKATPGGLIRLGRLIEDGRSDQLVKELSCVEAIEAVTPDYRRKGIESVDVLRRSPRGERGFIARVSLFNLGRDEDQRSLVLQFIKVCEQRGIETNHAGYFPMSFTYAAECRTVDDVEALSRLVAVRSIVSMPLVRTLRPQMFKAQALPVLTKRSDVAGDVPVVVVVDSGISDELPQLESWVVGRESYVARPYRNSDHGTFVAGLICWGAELNPTVPGIDPAPCALFDLQVIPNDEPSKGDTDSIGEQELLGALETALQQHANEYKVWNLSLGTDAVCSLDDFSEFAVELDNLQDRYNVSFVISAGNFTPPPLLDYPRNKAQLDAGRITTPADSVLGIAVGSVSHVHYTKDGPKQDEPSAFSRHGAGPNYVIKPDLVHYGGSCSTDAAHVAGIRSINGSGTAENLGTSFATPLVARSLAQIYHQITPTPTPVLARALLTHHARDPRTKGRVPDGEENFFGFGLPAPVPYCLECTPYSSTLIFEDQLRPGFYLEWDHFPYPDSLRKNGRYFGEIWMTVAFAPARGARWGSEYCETHIDAHFGVYRQKVETETGEIKLKFEGLVPPEHKNPGLLYESYQVANLRKWAPVRTYHGDLGAKGKPGERWRLKVQLLARHGIDDGAGALKGQPFSLIVTIADPTKRAPVYDEMARTILNRFQSQNLAVRAAARVRGRT
jgi:hypothetical protein